MKIKLKISYLFMLLIVIGCFGYIRSIYLLYTTVKYMGAVLLFAIWMILFMRKKRGKVPLVWTAVWIYITISTLLLNFPNSLRYFIVFSLGITLIILYSHENDFYYNLMRCFTLVGIFFSFGTIFQAFVPSMFNTVLKFVQSESLYEQTMNYMSRYGAFCGFAGESSFNAFCISIGILCLISKIFAERKISIYRIALILFSYYAILLTGKRSFVLLIPMIIFSVFLLYAIIEKKKASIIFLTVLILAIPFIFNFYLEDIIMEILASGKGNGNMEGIDLSNRELFWNIAFNMLESRPFFGHGMLSYDNFYNIFFNKNITFAGGHNSYFQLLAEMGWIGAGLYFFAIIKSIICGILDLCKIIDKNSISDIKLRVLAYCTVFIQTMCIIYGLSGNPFHRPQQLLTYFVAIAMGIYVHNRTNELARLD